MPLHKKPLLHPLVMSAASPMLADASSVKRSCWPWWSLDSHTTRCPYASCATSTFLYGRDWSYMFITYQKHKKLMLKNKEALALTQSDTNSSWDTETENDNMDMLQFWLPLRSGLWLLESLYTRKKETLLFCEVIGALFTSIYLLLHHVTSTTILLFSYVVRSDITITKHYYFCNS